MPLFYYLPLPSLPFYSLTKPTGRSQSEASSLQYAYNRYMSKFQLSNHLRLNVINKSSPALKVSIIVGGSLTISHLKRKIEAEFAELHGVELVVKLIEDGSGFIVSNNSTVEEHFHSGDTIYFSEHGEADKTGSNMNMASNLGEILSTVRFMTASALQKLDRIDLSNCNVMEMVPELLHIGLWFSNQAVVHKVYRIFNKLFGEDSIARFMQEASEVQMGMLLRNFTFWFADMPSPIVSYEGIIFQLLQLLEKFVHNAMFGQMVKTHKVMKTVLEMSKDGASSNEVKKTCVRIIKTVNGSGSAKGAHLTKIKSEYIPSMLGVSNAHGYGVEDILDLLTIGSPDEKVTALEYLAESGFEYIAEATVRSDFYGKLVNIFLIRKLKTKKHVTFFNQAVNLITNNTSKQQCIQIAQKDILRKVHSFMLESPVETHSVCLQYLNKICKVSSSAGMFNLEKSLQFLKSPYPEFQRQMISAIVAMSEKMGSVTSIRFIPGIKDYITLCLKTTDEAVTLDLLKILSNLTLDQQCRYQILNLKGVEVLVKFLETSRSNQICRAAAKGLLNLAISSRENKARVLGALSGSLQRFYRAEFDSITHGYLETILKSRNM